MCPLTSENRLPKSIGITGMGVAVGNESGSGGRIDENTGPVFHHCSYACHSRSGKTIENKSCTSGIVLLRKVVAEVLANCCPVFL